MSHKLYEKLCKGEWWWRKIRSWRRNLTAAEWRRNLTCKSWNKTVVSGEETLLW